MPHHPHSRVYAFVVPTLGIDSFRAENLQFAVIDLMCQHANHSTVFVFEESAHGSWEYQQRHSGMTKNQRFHVAMQFLAVCPVVFAIHREEVAVCAMRTFSQPKYLTRWRSETPTGTMGACAHKSGFWYWSTQAR